jgi:4-hydroxythreonine-4-phosphate dehydrogenase
MDKPIAVTLGDPVGIGPEVAVKTLLASLRLRSACLLVGDPGVVRREVRRAGRSPDLVALVGRPEEPCRPGLMRVLAVPCRGLTNLPYGRLNTVAGRMAAAWLETGARLALEGRVRALVTGPVNKAAIARTHRGFRGQTEFIAALAGISDPVMMLAGPTLKVVPVTRHIPLADVPRVLTADLVLGCIIGTARGLARWFGILRPRLAVCGLNPHAGERGLTGREDAVIVAPAVRRAVRAHVNASGPLPADTVFLAARRGRYDAVVAMYHDQAMIPIKTVEAEKAVNATLGLPFLRTSPAHGTAFDIAGKGRADCASMRAAIEMAVGAGPGRRR